MELSHLTQIPLQDVKGKSTISSLKIHGKIPSFVKGTLIRNGPAKFHFGKKSIRHWFDGMAMLEAFQIGDGNVTYKSRFLESDAYLKATKKDDLRFFGFVEDPCRSIFKRFFTAFFSNEDDNIVQNANVSIHRIAKQFVAMTETPLPVRFDPETLKTLGRLDYQDDLKKSGCFESAHPHYDFEKKEHINFQIEFGMHCNYIFYTVDAKSPPKRVPFFSMEKKRASYIHSFSVTENFIILVEYPLLVKPIDIVLKGGGYISQFEWDQNQKTHFHVISRNEGKRLRSFECDPFFSFHHVNAFEDRGKIVVDLVSYPDAAIVFGDPKGENFRKLERFILNQNTLDRKTIARVPLELPRINYESCNMRHYRYVYGVGFKYPDSKEDSIPILKVDIDSGKTISYGEKGCLAGEPVFVKNPLGTDEDDGVLLTFVSNQVNESSFLAVLDAKDLKMLARSDSVPYIPYGLHGMFFND